MTGDATYGIDVDLTRIADVTGSGSLTASSTSASITTLNGQAVAAVQITGTWVATVQFEGTVDGTNWFSVNAFPIASGTFVTSATANGQWLITTAGLSGVRVRCSAYTSGTIAITIRASIGAGLLTAANVAGDIASGSTDIGNPLKIGGKAATAMPTAVSNGQRVNTQFDSYGRLVITVMDPAAQVTKAYNTTSTATGAAIWTPAGGKKIALTKLTIGTYGTTAARVIVWFGASGDTTYTAGTDQLVCAFSFAPSTTSKPGAVLIFATPEYCTNADYILRVTTDAGISLDIAASGFEWA